MTRAGGRTSRAALTLALLARLARADLEEDVRVLEKGLGPTTTATQVLPPRLLTSRASVPLALPAAALDVRAKGCTTVMTLGAVSAVFALRLPGATPRASDLRTSVAGVSAVSRCGAEREELGELTIEMRSPHAIVETIVAESPAPLAPVESLLPHRAAGFVPGPFHPPGPAPKPAPLAARVAAFESAWSSEGATDLSERAVPIDESGAGRLVLGLSPGCHRVAVLADDWIGAGPVPDIDAELAWATGEPAAVDRTDSPDASLVVCTAVRDLSILAFAGGRERGAVVVLRGRTGIPVGIPDEWGPSARARIAKALLERHAPAPAAPPLYTSLGVAGVTLLPVELIPGQCYLAALTLVEGVGKLVTLTMDVGRLRAESHTDDANSAAIVTFCAGAQRFTTLETEVHGAALVTAVGVWALGKRRLGEDTP